MTSRLYPQYQCHKKVSAFKIGSIEQGSIPSPAFPQGSWVIRPDDPFLPTLEVGHDWFSKHAPLVGGYVVIYEDGYQSFSPAQAFESGYRRIASFGILTAEDVLLHATAPVIWLTPNSDHDLSAARDLHGLGRVFVFLDFSEAGADIELVYANPDSVQWERTKFSRAAKHL